MAALLVLTRVAALSAWKAHRTLLISARPRRSADASARVGLAGIPWTQILHRSQRRCLPAPPALRSPHHSPTDARLAQSRQILLPLTPPLTHGHGRHRASQPGLRLPRMRWSQARDTQHTSRQASPAQRGAPRHHLLARFRCRELRLCGGSCSRRHREAARNRVLARQVHLTCGRRWHTLLARIELLVIPRKAAALPAPTQGCKPKGRVWVLTAPSPESRQSLRLAK